MQINLQNQLAFFLTGRRGAGLSTIDSAIPIHLAALGDLSELRYDFPLVIDQKASPERTLRSLSTMVDEAVGDLAGDAERDRIARHGYRIERSVRRLLSEKGPGDLATVWHTSADEVARDDESVRDSAMRLWTMFRADGDIYDVCPAMPARAIRAAWKAVQMKKAKEFAARTQRLLYKLHGILDAETSGSEGGRTPDRLRAGVGTSLAGSFDFEAFSRILTESKPTTPLTDNRRSRIRKLITVLESQRFFPNDGLVDDSFGFEFSNCADTIKAYNERQPDSLELLRAIAVAELEAAGDYRESVHDVLFENFGANGLEVADLALLPDYLLCIGDGTIDAVETARIVEILAAGLPFKILFETADLLAPSSVAEGHVAFGLPARQIVHASIGLTDVFVLQASAARLPANRAAILRGLTYDGPALFSVFSGTNDHTAKTPPYLVAAAATESRIFPTIVYDPSAGSDWASRIDIADNSSVEEDWPVHRVICEDSDLQCHSEGVAFTAADFMSLDDRFSRHFALADKDDWSDSMIPVADALKLGPIADLIPAVTLTDPSQTVAKAIVDGRLYREVARCRAMWHSLQELAGIHNSHAERLLAEERRRAAPVADPAPLPVGAAPAPELFIAQAPQDEPTRSDDPYIETARCTTCNECTHVNSKMFVYNENKQAYIADADAGTFRQLVEAAEGCQVGIIHPGKPRNPKEPGLDDLLKRAEPFI